MKEIQLTYSKCGGKLERIIDNGQQVLHCPFCDSIYSDIDTFNYNKTININKNINKTKKNETEIYRIQKEYEKEMFRLQKEADDKKLEFKYLMLGTLIPLLLLAILGVSPIVYDEIKTRISEYHSIQLRNSETSKGKINAGTTSDYNGLKYNVVVTKLETLGFTNISVIDSDNASWLFKNDDEVYEISINGITSFGKDDYFYPDAKIIIMFH